MENDNEIVMSRNHPAVKLVRYMLGVNFNSICPLFWATVFSVIIIPFALPTIFMDYIIGDKIRDFFNWHGNHKDGAIDKSKMFWGIYTILIAGSSLILRMDGVGFGLVNAPNIISIPFYLIVPPLLLAIVLLILIIIIVGIAARYEDRKYKKRRDAAVDPSYMEKKKPSMLKEFIRAKKNKVCPPIRYED